MTGISPGIRTCPECELPIEFCAAAGCGAIGTVEAALSLADRAGAPLGMKILADEVRDLQGQLDASLTDFDALDACAVRVIGRMQGGERLLAVQIESGEGSTPPPAPTFSEPFERSSR